MGQTLSEPVVEKVCSSVFVNVTSTHMDPSTADREDAPHPCAAVEIPDICFTALLYEEKLIKYVCVLQGISPGRR